MKVLTVRFAKNPELMIRFYGALGLTVDERVSGGSWTELKGSGGTWAVHCSPESVEKTDDAAGCEGPGDGPAPAAPVVESCLEAEEPLENIQDSLRAAGFDPGYIRDEDFGRSLQVTDPEGFALQINGH